MTAAPPDPIVPTTSERPNAPTGPCEREPEPLLEVLDAAGLVVHRADGRVTARVRLDESVGLSDLGAVVGILADTAGGLAALDAAYPLGVATSDLTIHLTGAPVAAEETWATTHVVRRGRHSVKVAVEVSQAGAPEPVAHATVGFAVLGDRPKDASRRTTRHDPVRPGRTLRELLDIGRLVSDRVGSITLEVAIADDLRNTFGALNGGVLAAALARAARSSAPREVGARAAPVQLSVAYIAPGRVGPIVVTAQVRGIPAGARLVAVSATDAGPEPRLIARATALVGLVS